MDTKDISDDNRKKLIKEGFNQLVQLVPALSTGKNKSEAVVLQQTVEYMNQLIQERNKYLQLISQLNEELGQPDAVVDSDTEDLVV